MTTEFRLTEKAERDGVGAVGTIVADDDPRLAYLELHGYVAAVEVVGEAPGAEAAAFGRPEFDGAVESPQRLGDDATS